MNGLRPGEVANERPVAESIFTQPVEPNPETVISSVVMLESCHSLNSTGSSDHGGDHVDQDYKRLISHQTSSTYITNQIKV